MPFNPVKLIISGLAALFALIFVSSSFYVIEPGERGIVVTLGKVAALFSSEGLGFKTPMISQVVRVSIRQQTQELQASAFSSDLQQINVRLKILYRVPEASVISIYQQYAGNPFDSLIAPRVQEALKEVTALESAEGIARKRELVKAKTLELAKHKVGSMLYIEDIVIENIALSQDLENAIEAKMVQEQEAEKAKFTQQKAEIEAQTAVIRAEGEAKAISVRGTAIRANPGLIDLMIAEKWDGRTPLVVDSVKGGANILLPISGKE
ncbi:MAG: prohibitin family protein [Methylococcaceae bacterium]